VLFRYFNLWLAVILDSLSIMFIYIHGISFSFLLACLYFADLDLTQAESYGILKHPLLVSFVILQVYYYNYNIRLYQYKFKY